MKIRRKKVQFLARKQVAKHTRISFTTKSGKTVSFKSATPITKRVRVSFLAKTKK